jgi:cephalosporin-C deacetylase
MNMPTEEIIKFWDKAKEELAKVPIDANIEPQKITSDVTVTNHLVVMRSFGNVKIRAWYTVPSSPPPKGGWPAVMVVPAFVGVVINPGYLAQLGYATLTLYPRGQGESKHEWQLDGDTGTIHYKMAKNVTDPKKFYYYAAYLDCIRGLDFLDSRSEVDSSRMAVTGSSQGGGLTFAMAALDKRTKVAIARLPSLCNLPLAVEMKAEGCAELHDYLEQRPEERDAAMKTLSYIDNLNLADAITAHTLVSFAQLDSNHPYSTVMPVFEKIPSTKSVVIYPEATNNVHSGAINTDFNQHMVEWLKRYL